MNQPFTTMLLAGLTLAALVAWTAALRRVVRGGSAPIAGTVQPTLVGGIAAGSAGLFGYRWLASPGLWQPLAAHLDGLLLIAALLGLAILFFQYRPHMFGLSAFALPLLVGVLAWSVCASAWTYRPFDLETLAPVWKLLHLGCVYLGTLCAAVAAIAGSMFLYVHLRLKRKSHHRGAGNLASLETLEALIIRTATAGFALLTLALASGLVIELEKPDAAEGPGWFWPKILLAAAAWAAYAVVMNVKHATSFRGTRAAWLAIGGLVLLLATYGVVTSHASGVN